MEQPRIVSTESRTEIYTVKGPIPMRLNWKTVIRVAAAMTIFNGSTIDGRQQELRMDETVKVVTAVAPVFPPIVVASNTSGELIIGVTIDRAGRAIAARVIDGHPLLRQIKSLEDTQLCGGVLYLRQRTRPSAPCG